MDYLGTTDYLTSPVSGKVEAWTHYNEWGLITHNAVLKCGQRELDLVKRYATHDYDSVLELYYAKARFYDAHDRRFTAVDPILDPSEYDLREYVKNPVQLLQYLYVENAPLTHFDPEGEFLKELGSALKKKASDIKESVTKAAGQAKQAEPGLKLCAVKAYLAGNGNLMDSVKNWQCQQVLYLTLSSNNLSECVPPWQVSGQYPYGGLLGHTKDRDILSLLR